MFYYFEYIWKMYMYCYELLIYEYGRFIISNRRMLGIRNIYYIKNIVIIRIIFNFNGLKS